MKLQCRGIRGAITVSADSKESILDATKKLLMEMAVTNGTEIKDIAAIFFTTTPDLNAEFPASATRELGWPSNLAMLCGHEMNVPNDLPRCLRILMLVNTEKGPEEIAHVYLGEAKKLKNKPSLSIGGNT
ncbi:MAG: chorismate mutase [Dehalococcoidia bacterium]|nr:chorismate mutase [Dehalococcoidia bacterium]MCK5181322.1 chorismate mutase [Dehalococcoidia bacterium]